MANCPNCGAVINNGETFCSNCGAQIVPPAQAPAANGQANANYQQAPGWGQTPYPQQTYQPTYAPSGNRIVGVGDWFVTILLMAIPIVNIVMLFIWGFGSSTPESKSNWAKAQLIWMAIGIALSILITLLFGAALTSILSAGHYRY